MSDNPSTFDLSLNFGLGGSPGNSGVRMGVSVPAESGSGDTYYIELEDGSGFIELEDGSGLILLEIAP